MAVAIPRGLCQCGCGGQTRLTPMNCATRGMVKGEPRRYINGHASRRWNNYEIDANGCWLWLGTLNNQGYPYMTVAQRTVLSHRWHYERVRGSIPEGFELDHLCRMPRCVNPDHLEPVTNAENTQRGRAAKLSPARVREVLTSKESSVQLAKRLGVAYSTVFNVRCGRAWTNVCVDLPRLGNIPTGRTSAGAEQRERVRKRYGITA